MLKYARSKELGIVGLGFVVRMVWRCLGLGLLMDTYRISYEYDDRLECVASRERGAWGLNGARAVRGTRGIGGV